MIHYSLISYLVVTFDANVLSFLLLKNWLSSNDERILCIERFLANLVVFDGLISLEPRANYIKAFDFQKILRAFPQDLRGTFGVR